MTASPTRPAPGVADLADRLRRVLLRLSRQLRRESQSLGLSPLDAMLLGHVKTSEGIGVSELAEIEAMSRPAMSSHVKRLEAEGWIARRTPDPADRRRVGLALTPAGRRALDAVRRRRTDWLAARLAGLSPEDRAAVDQALAPLGSIIGDRP
jgi:DNA-binding MarR family transcriptional regulator